MADEAVSDISWIMKKHALVLQHSFPKPFRTFGPNIGARHGAIISFLSIGVWFKLLPAHLERFMHVTRVPRFYIRIEKRAVSSKIGDSFVMELCKDRYTIH